LLRLSSPRISSRDWPAWAAPSSSSSASDLLIPVMLNRRSPTNSTEESLIRWLSSAKPRSSSGRSRSIAFEAKFLTSRRPARSDVSRMASISSANPARIGGMILLRYAANPFPKQAGRKMKSDMNPSRTVGFELEIFCSMVGKISSRREVPSPARTSERA
jgi:hypothetical protein